jgi:simple sugar transport system permease protein
VTDFLLAALVRSTPLLLTGLAVAIAFRAGIWNIGAEGQFYAGAVMAAWIGTRWSASSPIVFLLVIPVAAALAGALWAGVPALLRARFGVLEVLTTIMLNFIAEHLVGFLVHGPLQEAGKTYPQSDPIAAAARLAPLIEGARLTWALPLGVLLAFAVWIVLTRTWPGFALRAAGASPQAARVSGRIPVLKVTTMAFLVSGAMAGLAGAAEVCGVTFALYEKLSPGYGYTAIAVALLARLHPLAVIASALAFGALEAGASALQRSYGIPSVTVYAIEALVILLIVATERRLRRVDG